MIPEDCKRDCIHYLEERENNWRDCQHPDREGNECPGWLSVDDAKYANVEGL